jgi:putative acetyltransferase
MPLDGIHIREGRDDDADALIALIGGVFAEYAGCVLDVDGELPELRAIATAYGAVGGRFHVAELHGSVCGCVGFVPAEADPSRGVELRKLYVAQSARRNGLGSELVGRIERAARERGMRYIDLWTDTRFGDAHRLYERVGFVRGAATRELHDRSASVEYYYRRDL